MKYKLICLDIDGTLGSPKSGGDFRQRADDWAFFPGRIEFCQKLVADGATLITCSNQGGVCFPWSKFTEEEITLVLESTAKAIGAVASLVSCSSTHEKALDKYRFDDPRRKPKPGMILEAMHIAGVEASETLMIGDREEDRLAAEAADVDFEWADRFFS